MKKKILILGMAIAILFSVLAFGAGTCVIYDPRVEELLEQVRELEDRLRLVEEENRLLREQEKLREYQAEARRELREFVNEMRRYESFLRLGVAIFAHVDDGLDAIDEAISKDEVDKALEAVKGAVADLVAMFEELDWAFSECRNFALHASVDNTTVSYGDYFVVEIKLKNLTGRDVGIGFSRGAGVFFQFTSGIIFDEWSTHWINYDTVYFERNGILYSMYKKRINYRAFCARADRRNIIVVGTDIFWWVGDTVISNILLAKGWDVTIADYVDCLCWSCIRGF